MLKEYLDTDTYTAIIKAFNFDDITEIRMRLNHNLIVCIKNRKYFLKDAQGEYVIVSEIMLKNFLRKICENSIYAYNQEIINGYITLPKGIRVGLCGTAVMENGKITTIKDFQAVNIRIPHTIKNCSLPIFDLLLQNGDVLNTLIISSPGAGKTTFLRDFIYQLNAHNLPLNVLVVDERGEICSTNQGYSDIDLGGFCDIITNSTKQYAFKNGIRSMNPDVIATDEIDLDNDLNCITEAINCGVNIVATIHANDMLELQRKANFDNVISNKYFKRFVFLSKDQGAGTIKQVLDEKLNVLYCG